MDLCPVIVEVVPPPGRLQHEEELDLPVLRLGQVVLPQVAAVIHHHTGLVQQSKPELMPLIHPTICCQ